MKQIFKWSIPFSVENACYTLLTMVIANATAAFGADALAAARVGSQLEALAFLVGGGFASGLAAFVGQNYGARKFKRIKEGVRTSIVLMTIYGTAITLFLVFGARVLMSFFFQNEDVIHLGIMYLRIIGAVQLFACLEFIAAGAFRGMGKTKPPSVISITFNALRIPVALGLGATHLGLYGIWLGMAIVNALRAVALLLWYVKRGDGGAPSRSE